MSVPYQLGVVCDHRRNAPNSDRPPRLVSTIVHFPKPPPEHGRERVGWLEWREVQGDGVSPALQTYFGEALRLGRTSRSHGLDDLVPGMDHGQRWRFECPDCDDTVPIRHERLVELLDVMRSADVPSVTLAALATRV